MFHFNTPWKNQKTFDFLIFSGVIEVEHWVNILKIWGIWVFKEPKTNN